MNKLLKLFAVILLISSCGKAETSKLVIETEAGDITYNIETASTVKELEVGLMNRDSLAQNAGMLFDLSNVPNEVTAMWMKDTKLSLDMLFLTKEGVVYWIKENAQPYSEELIIAPFPAAAVLEINAGDVAKHQIKIGQNVKHPMFKEMKHDTAAKPTQDKAADEVKPAETSDEPSKDTATVSDETAQPTAEETKEEIKK